MKATLVRRSICPCGFAVINDDVPIGKVYDLDVQGMVADDGNDRGFLPVEVFDVHD